MTTTQMGAALLLGAFACWVAGRSLAHAAAGLARVLDGETAAATERVATATMAGALAATAVVLIGTFVFRLLLA